MPKYFEFKVAGCYLYFTSHCVAEPMHVHASASKQLNEAGSAKFFVEATGDALCVESGVLKPKQVREIANFIKTNVNTMYATWKELSSEGFYHGK